MNKIKRSSIALLVNFIICFSLFDSAFAEAEEPPNELFVVTIGSEYEIRPGHTAYVPVTLFKAPYDMIAFEFLISYDMSLLSFQGVEEGPLFFWDNYCDWEYFEYRHYDSSSDCSNGNCIPGTIKVLGIADIGSNLDYPNCLRPEFAADFFQIRFRLSSNINESCNFIPIKFIWNDCYDNSISIDSLPGDGVLDATSAVAYRVFTNGEIIPFADSFPSFSGPADSCITNSSTASNPVKRLIEFHNGGIYVECDSSDYLIGDIDLDGLPFQSNDAAIFREYFLKGESAFSIHPAKQRAATDINKDGYLAQLNDLVQLDRIVLEELHPDSVIDGYLPGSNIIINDRDNKRVTMITPIATEVLWLKFFGEVTPVNIAEDYVVVRHYDGIFTRMIMENHKSADTGDVFLFEYEGEGGLFEVQRSTHLGERIEFSVYYIINCGLGLPCSITLSLGDVNLNGIACEVADWVIFRNYFLYGEQVFKIDPFWQTYNTDLNIDNLFLTIEDYVLLTRTIIGDARCATYFDSTSPNIATFRQNQLTQQIEVITPDSLGAVVLVFNGEINPTANDTNYFSLGHNFDNGLTRVLTIPNINNIISLDSIFITDGLLITYTGTGQLIEAHTATNKAVKVNSVIDVATDITEQGPDNLPEVFALHQNYPNPFNIETTIKFDLPRASEVSFEIINILGQIVYNVTSRYSAGSHTIYWDGSLNSGQTVGSGVYYYRITAGDFVSSKKMILLK